MSHAVLRAGYRAGMTKGGGGPLVGIGEFVRDERAVLAFVVRHGGEAGAEAELLAGGGYEPGAVGHPGIQGSDGRFARSSSCRRHAHQGCSGSSQSAP
jgi:hypothetical protein